MQQLKVLLIEDNPADVALMEAEIEDLSGFCLTVANDLKTALNALEEQEFDLAVLDLNLPDAEGLQGLERLIGHFPTLPVVVLSGFGADDLLLAREAVRLGAQEFLGKGSVSAPELERIAYLAIDRKALEQHRIRWSRHDQQTGLPNLKLIEERFPRAANRCERTNTHLAIMHVKISGLEQIRIEHGIDMHDKALRATVTAICNNVRRNDTVGILEDGALIVLAECMRNASDAYAVARKLLATVADRISVDGQSMHVWLSIGVAHRTRQCSDFEPLMQAASDAVIKAQSDGGRCYRGPEEKAA